MKSKCFICIYMYYSYIISTFFLGEWNESIFYAVILQYLINGLDKKKSYELLFRIKTYRLKYYCNSYIRLNYKPTLLIMNFTPGQYL